VVVRFLSLLLALTLLTGSAGAQAEERFITVASTTSTENSGLFAHILPLFTEASGIDVRVVAVGTGQAIKLAKNGDADVLLVHHKPSEEAFVALAEAPTALARIAAAEAPFASRGDDSGTHKKELGLWLAAGVDAAAASGTWYRETGAGMGATLNTASGMDAYALSDRATWLKFANKGSLEILVEGDPELFNQYGVILVSPQRHPHVKAGEGEAFIKWLTSPAGQAAIAAYRIDGAPAFFPNARKAGS
jgi:tungstate transport system substrate-binding protein